jgi:Spy/CpxP family protein refolding chaperone
MMSIKHNLRIPHGLRIHTKPLVSAALALAILVPALSTVVVASPRQDRSQRGRQGSHLDRELAETLQQLMIVRMKRALELTPEQEKTVVPLMQDLTQQRRADQRSRMEGLRSLAALSQDSAASEEMLTERLESFYADQAAGRETEMELLTALREELTPRQEARMLAFEERFRSEIRNRMQAARGQRERARPDADRPDSQNPR